MSPCPCASGSGVVVEQSLAALVGKCIFICFRTHTDCCECVFYFMSGFVLNSVSAHCTVHTESRSIGEEWKRKEGKTDKHQILEFLCAVYMAHLVCAEWFGYLRYGRFGCFSFFANRQFLPCFRFRSVLLLVMHRHRAHQRPISAQPTTTLKRSVRSQRKSKKKTVCVE